MKLCVLASGSKGNSIYIEAGNTKLLVDVGLCCSKIQERLKEIGVSPEEIDGILITHEHTDHIKGVSAFSNRYNTKVYVHEKCYPYFVFYEKDLNKKNVITFCDHDFFLKDFTVSPFFLPHDCMYAVGFSLYHMGKKVSIATDFGSVTSRITERLMDSDILVIECNHNEDMLINGPYPKSLKNRIVSRVGHISNTVCGTVIKQVLKGRTRRFILAHLSETNNTESQAIADVLKEIEWNISDDVEIDVAYQNRASKMYIID